MKSPASANSQAAPGDQKEEIRSLPAGETLPPQFLDGLPGMIYLARPDRLRTIEMASAGCRDLLGLSPEHKPLQLTPLMHPEERDQVLEVIKSALAQGQPYALEYRLRHASGAWRTVWEQGRPIQHGPRMAVQGQLLDVTHRLQREQSRLSLELRLLQAQKFQALNQLASGVAHEFNNLIAGILGSAELVAMDLPENNPGQETLKQIFEASNHARDFVYKLRMLGQRPPLEFKLIRLQPVIEECLQILRSIIPAKVELEARINPDCPKINADAAQLHQAIFDLCLHAWQGLADRRGRIEITLENCGPGHPPTGSMIRLQPGPHVRLTLQDNSPGLEKSAREHIFHPFRNRRAGGTKMGLELFLVRETVQAHQGEICLESELGRGLTFHIYLPAADEK
jgi:PAS domain S-box-containing protein